MTSRLDVAANRGALLVDRACDVGLVLFALLTVTYHLAAAAHWNLTSWLAAWLVVTLLASGGLVVARRRRPEPADPPDPPQRTPGDPPAPARAFSASPLVVALVTAGAVVAVVCQSTATNRLWPVAWLVLAATTALAVAIAWRSRAWTVSSQERNVAEVVPAAGHLLALAVTVGVGILSLFVVRPDADDVYYANRAVWVAQHGAIPLRDTMFGNQVFPAPPGEKVPVASIEAVQGALARAFGVPTPTVVWLVTTMVASMLACWTLWRLVRCWTRPDRAALVFAVACVFLGWDAWNARSIGNFHLVRLWQGKSVFVSCLVPAIYVWLTRWLRQRRRSDALMLFLLGVCAVGLTSSAVFLVPLLAAVGAVAGLIRGRRALAGPALLATYPIGTGLAIVALEHGEGAPATFESAPQVFAHLAIGTGVVGLIGWLGLLAGPWCSRGGWPRALAFSSVGVLAAVVAPGVHTFIGRVSGAGPVLWRETWIVPLPALVGMLAVVPLSRRGRLSRIPAPVLAALPAAVLAAVLIATGRPLWSEGNHARIAAAAAWKVSRKGQAGAAAILRRHLSGGLVLAPATVMSAMSETTTRVYPVVPRDIYLPQLGGADARGRLALFDWLTRQRTLTVGQLGGFLSQLDVRQVCLPTQARVRLHVLANLGYAESLRADWLTCRRLPAGHSPTGG